LRSNLANGLYELHSLKYSGLRVVQVSPELSSTVEGRHLSGIERPEGPSRQTQAPAQSQIEEMYQVS